MPMGQAWFALTLAFIMSALFLLQPKCDGLEVDFGGKDAHYDKRKKEIIGM